MVEPILEPYVMDWVLFFQKAGDGIAIGCFATITTGLFGFIINKFIKLMKG